jgi:predicted nucleic acid-binding protein
LVLGFLGTYTLIVSGLVLDETERNLRRKAAAAIPAFQIFRSMLSAEPIEPSEALIAEAARVVALKDAPILAAALQAHADYLVTYDRRHLLGRTEAISAEFGIRVATPEQVLDTL